MPIVVVAKPKAEFLAWLAEQKAASQQASTDAAAATAVTESGAAQAVTLAKAE
jgi:heme/copper-type cytochrome/quinol oxidase subunit 2